MCIIIARTRICMIRRGDEKMMMIMIKVMMMAILRMKGG